MEHKFLFFDEVDAAGRESYEYFKKNKRFTHKDYDEFKKWLQIARGLITDMNVMYGESDGGLYLKDLGYFLYLPKYLLRGRRISVIRRRKDKFRYEQSFIPLCDELLSFRIEGTYLTDKTLIPELKKLDQADEFHKQSAYLRGRMKFLKPTKYMEI